MNSIMKTGNCQKQSACCTLDGNCLSNGIVNTATVSSENEQVYCTGMIGTVFEDRCNNHDKSYI